MLVTLGTKAFDWQHVTALAGLVYEFLGKAYCVRDGLALRTLEAQ